MGRHASVTDDFIEKLNRGFFKLAEAVRSAKDWPEAQKLMTCGTYAYKVALDRVEEGWDVNEIQSELDARTLPLHVPGPIRVLGSDTIKVSF